MIDRWLGIVVVGALLTISGFNSLYAQHEVRIQVVEEGSSKGIDGATVKIEQYNKGAFTDSLGQVVFTDLPSGECTIGISMVGFSPASKLVFIPLAGPIVVALRPVEIEEIIVSSTRANRSIAETPTRIEVLTEEIEEAASMDPGKIQHLITHSTGLQVQQTSAVSGSANVRIQGFDGRYAQILQDGLPMYGGFSSSLSIMQIPPLDLRQVEYIKGSASTLYGAGAISGIINLLSKVPEEKPKTALLANVSSLGGFDLSVFSARRVGKLGVSVYGSRNTQAAFDANHDGYTDLPWVIKNNIFPRLYFQLSDSTTLMVGGMLTDESRVGGDMRLVRGHAPSANHFYVERNQSKRTTNQLLFTHRFHQGWSLHFKQSYTNFERIIAQTDYRFNGIQKATFWEISANKSWSKSELITGLNYYTDHFRDKQLDGAASKGERLKTVGAFALHNWRALSWLALESGIRVDNNLDYGTFVLPRLSGLIKWLPQLTSRISGGLGYRAPTLFNPEAEALSYRNVNPVRRGTLSVEQTMGLNADITWTHIFSDKWSLKINQLFFYNELNNPIVLAPVADSLNRFEFVNSRQLFNSRGFETWIKLIYSDFTWFIGYTYTDAAFVAGNQRQPFTLTPEHSLKGDILYFLPQKWRIGLDYEYKSSQLLAQGRRVRDLFMTGIVLERFFPLWSAFINFENITDVRQSRFESLLVQPENTPRLLEVWAPLDGFFWNIGFRINL
jgi:outer membrane receptor for ferrienterochelin and colicins